jgi:hypothetical protein
MTAVEWLFDNLDLSGGSEAIETLKQAKEMEKEQIIDAFKNGFSTTQWDRIKENKAEQYYNETYKPE